MAEVLAVSRVLVERARQHVRYLKATGRTVEVALQRIADARPVNRPAPPAA